MSDGNRIYACHSNEEVGRRPLPRAGRVRHRRRAGLGRHRGRPGPPARRPAGRRELGPRPRDRPSRPAVADVRRRRPTPSSAAGDPRLAPAMATSAEATRPADHHHLRAQLRAQFARLLDFYRVEWEYEPTAFPIEWDAAGRPLQHFRPRLLPAGVLPLHRDHHPQPALVTKKNRKVRRLRELYPDGPHQGPLPARLPLLLAKYGLEPRARWSTHAGGRPGTGRGSAARPGGPRPRLERGAGRREAGWARGRVAAAGRGAGRGGWSKRRGGPDPPWGGGAGAGGGAAAGGARPAAAVPPLPADPELVRLAQVLLPAERATAGRHRGGRLTQRRPSGPADRRARGPRPPEVGVAGVGGGGSIAAPWRVLGCWPESDGFIEKTVSR
jgi:hypothetical protein